MAGLRFTNGDAISAALLAGLGAYILVEARAWPYMGPDGPGPAFFPMWYGVALIALSLVVIIARLWTLRSSPENKKRMSAAQRSEVLHALAVWLAFAVTVALLKVLGFLLAFGLFTFFIVALIYRRSWKTALGVGVASAAGFYLVFTLALGVELPVGAFGF
jgi:putative tricarboxylic transport membrane protein